VIGRIFGVVALVAIAALAAGCGDGSEASSEVTKAQFTKEAEAICAERKEDWDAGVAEFTKETKAEKLGFKAMRKRSEAFFAESVLPLLQTELEALEELDVPAEDEAKVEKMLQNRAQGVEKLEAEGVEVLLDPGTFGEYEKEEKAYGLECGLA
jgi:hypothetical protein